MTMRMSQEMLKSVLEYNPETGIFTRVQTGEPIVNNLSSNRVIHIKVGDASYCAHRLAWLYVYGELDDDVILHRNENKRDNRICNLYKISKRDQLILSNKTRVPNNNLKGAYRLKKDSDRWKSSIYHKGKKIFLGCYDTEQEAHQAYVKAVSALRLPTQAL